MATENKSFHTIYKEHSNLVFSLALQYVQNNEDAEDITQEVFVKLYQNIGKFDGSQASIKTWIYRIAINHSLDFLKAKTAKKRFGFITSLFNSASNEPFIEASHFNHPGVAAEDKEALQKIYKYINELPDNQRTAFILVRLEDKNQKEVAEIMETSVKAVESLLQRAKQSLQKKINFTEGYF